MRYLLLIHEPESGQPAAGTPEWEAWMGEYKAFGEELTRRGIPFGGAALDTTDTATSVRIRGDERLITDGPFAETKEQFNGFYSIDVPDLDTAIEVAAMIPGARTGTVEVRPAILTGAPA